MTTQPKLVKAREFLTSSPGSRFIYHVGHLGSEREERFFNSAGEEVVRPVQPADAIAILMWDAYERGEVALVQRRAEREGESVCQYIAVRL